MHNMVLMDKEMKKIVLVLVKCKVSCSVARLDHWKTGHSRMSPLPVQQIERVLNTLKIQQTLLCDTNRKRVTVFKITGVPVHFLKIFLKPNTVCHECTLHLPRKCHRL